MRYIICANLPENHALNNEWMLKQQLSKLGFTDIWIKEDAPVQEDSDNNCRNCASCSSCADSAIGLYYCTDGRNNGKSILNPEHSTCSYHQKRNNLI